MKRLNSWNISAPVATFEALQVVKNVPVNSWNIESNPKDPESIRTARYLQLRCTTFDDSSQKRMFQVASKTSESSDTQLFCCNNQLMRTREHLRRPKRAPLDADSDGSSQQFTSFQPPIFIKIEQY